MRPTVPVALLALALAAACADPAEEQNEQEEADTGIVTTPLDSAVQGIDVDTSVPLDAPMATDSAAAPPQ